MSRRIEDLQCEGLKIVQDDELYTFTSDSVILANFVKTKKDDFAVEIGTGCGVISILVQAKNELSHVLAFEIQHEMAELARENIERNDLCGKIEIVEDDVKNHQKYVKSGAANVVFSNPPFHKTTSFPQSNVKKIAKEDVSLTCEELCRCASEMLCPGGNFYVCYEAERCAELILRLQQNNLTPKEMFFTENGKGKVRLVVIRATKGGKSGCKVYPNLVTNSDNGDYLEILKTKNFK